MQEQEQQTSENKSKSQREVEFLMQLHQAAQMGRDTLEHVNNNIGAGELRDAITKDIFDYSDIIAQITRKLECYDETPEKVRKLMRKMAEMMINCKVNPETPYTEIAKMIIDGTTKGITECTAKLTEFCDVDNDIKNICYKLLWVQQKNVDEMKRFL